MLGLARIDHFLRQLTGLCVMSARRFLSLLFVLFAQTTTYAATYSSYWNMPRGVTSVSHDIYRLHMIAFWVGVGICVLVFGWMLFIFVRYRHSKGAVSGGINEHLGVELLWTIIPAVLLVIIAIPATKVLIRIHDDTKPDMTVKVTGSQWKWSYEYLDQGISFISKLSTPQSEIYNQRAPNPNFLLEVDHPLVLPVGKKVRLLITSNDVIHDWWVPDLGVKQDAIPGYVNETWTRIDTVGTYRGECAELCGTFHGFMPIVVKAVSPAMFKQWVATQKIVGGASVKKTMTPSVPLGQSALLALGQTVYEKNCAVCHQLNGKGLPPTFPGLKGGAITTGPLAAHVNIVLHGKKGTAMQAFSEQLGPKELAAVITYERQAWGNAAINHSKGHAMMVHSADIIAAKGKENAS